MNLTIAFLLGMAISAHFLSWTPCLLVVISLELYIFCTWNAILQAFQVILSSKKGVVSELISVGNALFAKNKKWYGYLVQHCTYDRVGLVIFTKLEKESTLLQPKKQLYTFFRQFNSAKGLYLFFLEHLKGFYSLKKSPWLMYMRSSVSKS